MPKSIPTLDVLHKYGPDYKVIFVGDAAMSPYEITMPGGSVEHWNPEAGRGLAAPRARSNGRTPSGSTRRSEKHWGYTQFDRDDPRHLFAVACTR